MKKPTRILAALLIIFLCLAGCNQEANADRWVAPDSYDGVQSKTGYFYLQSGFLYYTDFATGNSVCLCARAGCWHDDEKLCDSWIGSGAEMFFWEEKLYYLQPSAYGPHLYRRNQDGTGLATVATLCQSYMEEDRNISIQLQEKVVTGGYLYYTAEVQAVVNEDGHSMHKTQYYLLQQVDLKTGKEKTILKDELVFSLVSAKGNRIRYRTGEEVKELVGIDKPDHDTICNAYKNTKTWITELDIGTGKETVLLESNVYNLFSVEIVDDERIIYMSYESDDIYSAIYYSCDLRTGKSEFYYEGDLGNTIDGRYSLYRDSQRRETLLVDIETKQELPIHAFYGEGVETNIKMVNPVGDYVILRRYRRPEPSSSIGEQIYFFVPISALADGLQEADCTDYYTWKRG